MFLITMTKLHTSSDKFKLSIVEDNFQYQHHVSKNQSKTVFANNWWYILGRGRNNNQNTIREIKHSEKSVSSTEKFTEIFNEFEDFITKRASIRFSFKAVNESLVCMLIGKLYIARNP